MYAHQSPLGDGGYKEHEEKKKKEHEEELFLGKALKIFYQE